MEKICVKNTGLNTARQKTMSESMSLVSVAVFQVSCPQTKNVQLSN